MTLSHRLRELAAIVMCELDALADGDRSSTWTTLEETSVSLSAAVEQAEQLEGELDRARLRVIEKGKAA